MFALARILRLRQARPDNYWLLNSPTAWVKRSQKSASASRPSAAATAHFKNHHPRTPVSVFIFASFIPAPPACVPPAARPPAAAARPRALSFPPERRRFIVPIYERQLFRERGHTRASETDLERDHAKLLINSTLMQRKGNLRFYVGADVSAVFVVYCF